MSNLMRWEPLTEFDQIRRQMDRMLGNVLGRGFGGPTQLSVSQAFVPNVELYVTDSELVVNAELPGLDPEHVNVEITEDSVMLSGELKQEQEIKQDSFYRTERLYGQFNRVIPLPDPIKETEAKATFTHGVLTIRAPLARTAEQKKPHRLQIESK